MSTEHWKVGPHLQFTKFTNSIYLPLRQNLVFFKDSGEKPPLKKHLETTCEITTQEYPPVHQRWKTSQQNPIRWQLPHENTKHLLSRCDFWDDGCGCTSFLGSVLAIFFVDKKNRALTRFTWSFFLRVSVAASTSASQPPFCRCHKKNTMAFFTIDKTFEKNGCWYCWWKKSGQTSWGWQFIPLFTGFYTSQAVRFFKSIDIFLSS